MGPRHPEDTASDGPMRLHLPIHTFFGLSVENLGPANARIEEAIVSGEAQRKYTEILATCCGDLVPASKRDAIRRQFLDNVRLDLFTRYWSPATSSCDGVVAMFTFLTVLFSTDDVRDDAGADADQTARLSAMWSSIPALVNKLWVDCNATDSRASIQELYESALKLQPSGSTSSSAATVELHARLLTMASVQVRVQAGSDAAFEWFASECAMWGEHSFAIRQRDMAMVTTSELLDHRYREGATTLTIVHALVSSGLPISARLVNRFTATSTGAAVFLNAGLHICLVNDVLSYDRDQHEAGFLQNFVEFQRRFHVDGNDFDTALCRTVDQCNAFVDAFEWAVGASAGNDSEQEAEAVRVILDAAARGVLGNIRWSVECRRYSRTELVRALVQSDAGTDAGTNAGEVGERSPKEEDEAEAFQAYQAY